MLSGGMLSILPGGGGGILSFSFIAVGVMVWLGLATIQWLAIGRSRFLFIEVD